MELRDSIYLLFMLLVHVMRGAGTFTFEEKVKMIDFLSYVLQNTDIPLLDSNTGNSSTYKARETNHSNTPRIN